MWSPADKLLQVSYLSWPVPPARGTADSREDKQSEDKQSEDNSYPDDDDYDWMRRTLSAAKSELDGIPKREFDTLSKIIDPYAWLRETVRKITRLPFVTNATLKMIEIAMQEAAFRTPDTRAFCNAELPGAFVLALSHAAVALDVGFTWLASSYYPGDGADVNPDVLGDKYHMYANHRDRWLMGPRPNALPVGAPPVSGDLTDPAVVAALAAAVKARYAASPGRGAGCDLYTSDAGVDASGDYNRQEETTALLNFGQVLCGLLSLADGGMLITKQYTYFTRFNRSLIAVVSGLFDEFRIVKPLTSRPANSEIYLVGHRFRGIPPALEAQLLAALAAARTVPVEQWPPLGDPTASAAIPRALLRIARQLCEQQIAFLDEMATIHKLRMPTERLRRQLEPEFDQRQRDWVESCIKLLK